MTKQQLLSGGALLALLMLNAACQQPTAATATPAVASPSPVVATASAQNSENEFPRISVQDAKAALDKGDAIIIDVRGPDAYKIAHIKGALEHSLNRLEQGDFRGLPKDKQIIAYCSCPAENSSGRAVNLLQKAGYTNVAALVGGNAAWEAAGYEMVKASSASPSPAATAAPQANKPRAKAKAEKQ